MTRVFGVGSPEWNEGASRRSPAGTAARTLAQTDFVGIAIHCATRRRHLHGNANAKPDPLPDEAGGYTGFKALFGAKYVNPAITNGGSRRVERHRRHADRRPVRPAGLPGLRRHVREEHARLRRPDAGARRPGHVRLHLRRARRPRRLRRTSTSPTGPARPATSSSSTTTTRRSATSSPASRATGSPRTTRCSSFTVEEGDHFAGTAPDARCDGVTTPCTYANGHVTEVNGDLKRLVATYNASHGTTATTNFSVHSDLAPNVYITGNPARDSATARELEQAMSDMTGDEPALGQEGEAVRRDGRPGRGEAPPHGHGRRGADADVHAVRAGRLLPERIVDRAVRRTTTSSTASSCRTRVGPNQTFAWNHGGIQPEIAHDVGRLRRPGRSRRSSPAPTSVVDRSHRPAADDARAARPQGRLRLRRPRHDRVPQGRRDCRSRSTRQGRRGARPGLEADQGVRSARSRWTR